MSEATSNGFAVAAMLHPGIWTGHGLRQVQHWLQRYSDDGMVVIRPDEEWRSALISADWVISDHGSTCLYAAAAGATVLRTDVPSDLIVSGSPIALLHELTPSLHRSLPIHNQLLEATAMHEEFVTERIMERSTSAPGRSAELTRSVIYKHLRLDEPSESAKFGPVVAIHRARHSKASSCLEQGTRD
jgi:hypothetical protein